MNNMNVITIEKNVPIPSYARGVSQSAKYRFIETMQPADSFMINGATPDFTPCSVRGYVYNLNATTDKRFTIRTLVGPYNSPEAIRVWRVK